MIDALSAPRKRWIWPVVLVLVTLLAFGLRWYYVSTAMVLGPIRGDAQQYYAYAWNLYYHGVFAGNPPGSTALIPSSYRDPGYPAFLAMWMAAFKDWPLWYAAVLMCQALLGALTVTCAMQVGRRWLDWRWLAGAGVLMAVWPQNITIASNLLTETLFGFLCALAMLLCARACDRRSLPWAIVAGVCFGAAALTNAILLPFGVLLALYLAWRHHAPRGVWITLLIASLVLPGAWAIRNSRLPPQATGQSSTDRALQNFVQGSWPVYHDAYMAMVQGDQRAKPILRRIDLEYELLRSAPRKGMAVIGHRMARDPWHFVSWYILKKPPLLWGWGVWLGQNDIYIYAAKYSPFDTQPVMRALVSVCYAINPALAALMLASLVMALTRRRSWRTKANGRAMLEAVLAITVFVTLVYCTLQSAPRYSTPFRDFEMLLAMTACSALVGWLRRHMDAIRHRPPADAG